MEISLKDLEGLYLAHNFLLGNVIPIRLGYMLTLNLRELDPKFEDYKAKRGELQDRYAHKENGQIMLDTMGQVIYDNKAGYDKELADLQGLVIDVKLVTLLKEDMLALDGLLGNVIYSLMPVLPNFLNEPKEQE